MKKGAYYNEFEPFAAHWLRNLIAKKLIPAGDVDERSIVEVQPSDLTGYAQCHFFAGIGGWALGARLAGWPDDRELWTGSCPCQPFSVAGQQKGFEDERHLWPEFHRLIRDCWPAVVMGEQVAAAIGKAWLDRVFDDLENDSYTCRAVVLPACSVGAPHKRNRLWFIADGYGSVGDAERVRRDEGITGDSREEEGSRSAHRMELDRSGTTARTVGDAATPGLPGQPFGLLGTSGQGDAAWDSYDTIECLDGKYRRIEPGTPPLADGVPSRVGRLRAYGNAISPQQAAEIIGAFKDCTP